MAAGKPLDYFRNHSQPPVGGDEAATALVTTTTSFDGSAS
jgi:hypothetical protein